MPDLILLDIQMPRINGYQVCRLLKDHPAMRDIPIVLVTGAPGFGIVQDPRTWSFQTGADGYLEKSEDVKLVETVGRYLGDRVDRSGLRGAHAPMNEVEIMSALSALLDRQLYLDVTRLRELNEKKNAFVANVSHELKSPLTIIKGHLDNLMNGVHGELAEPQRPPIRMAMQAINRLTRLISDLLDLAKIEAGVIAMKKEALSLAEVVRAVLDEYRVSLDAKRVALREELPAEALTVLADRDRLTQVVINLLSNAIKFTPEGGAIAVRLAPSGSSARVEIEDSGAGIPREDLERIFDKFERIHAEKVEGTGLGLPIARDIILLHGGEVWAESEVGKGSRFIFTLPLVKS
jgi:signal transduction histidine kinase